MTPGFSNAVTIGAAGFSGMIIFVLIVVGISGISSGAFTAERFQAYITISDYHYDGYNVQILSGDGRGYIISGNPDFIPVKDKTYWVSYYCNTENQRMIEKITPLSEDTPYNCRLINGECL